MGEDWQDRGSTLAEMLVAIGLAALVISCLMSLYWASSNALLKLTAAADAQYSARIAIHKMSEDIRGALSVSIPEGGSNLLLVTANNETVNYYTANTELYRDGLAKVPVAENISSICFAGASALVSITVIANVNGTDCQMTSNISPRLAVGQAREED